MEENKKVEETIEKKENIFKRAKTAVQDNWNKWGKKVVVIGASIGAGIASCHFVEGMLNKRKGDSEDDPEIEELNGLEESVDQESSEE